MQRCKFNARVRLPGESVATYCTELRTIAEHCEFDASLENMLRDRLVCGIADKAMQQRLLSEPNLDFQKAYDLLAVLMESVRKDTAQLQTKPNPSTEVHAVRKATDGSRDKPAPRQANAVHPLLPLWWKTQL